MLTLTIMDLNQLFSTDFNLNQIAVYYVKTPEGKTSYTLAEHGRVNQGFVFVCSHYFIFNSPDKEAIRVSAGEMVYLPKYAKYTHTAYLEKFGNETADIIVVNFNMSDHEGKEIMLSEDITKYNFKENNAVRVLFESISAAYAVHLQSYAKVKSLLYEIFSLLCSEYKYHPQNPSIREYMAIRDAIRYIEQNSCSNISISELAKMSFISENSFRKLFKSYSGMLPSDYIKMLKMEKAKFFLKEQRLTVTETAQILNFTDIAYFSRVFKKYTGQSPSCYQ